MTNTPNKSDIVELRPNIYQIRLGRPSSHCYIIKGKPKNVLIDTGMAATYPKLVTCLAELGLEPGDIHLIILTHEHFDHIGATAYMFRKSVVAAHPLAANKIELQDEFVMMSKYLDLSAEPFHADIWLEGDVMIELGNYRLRVLHTPGHVSGCICLHEPDHGLLFTGDTVFAGGALSGIFGSGSISDYVHSLKRLNGLHIEEFYPGHGPISKTPQEDIQKAVADSCTLMEDCKVLFEAIDTKTSLIRYVTSSRKTKKPQ
jgi:glyoxylase-like metal-dependent hydrolase (beta-lactamase superfamily II)